MKAAGIIKIMVIVSVVLLLSSGLMVDIHGKDIKRGHRERGGSFEGLVFNNRRIILIINKDGSATIKSAKDGKVLIEKMQPIVEIKERGKWVDVKFNHIKIRERDHGKWHTVKIKMEHRGKIRVKVMLKYFEKRKFKRYKPLYPSFRIWFSKKVQYRVEWVYKGVNLQDIAIIDNGTGYLQAPYRSGHEAHIIYNGSANINASFREDQDILKGYAGKDLQMGLNWENSKNVYDVLEVRNDSGHTNIVIMPSKSSTSNGKEYLTYRAPIPDSGTGEGKDSDGDGLYDVTEESGWDITWYDSQGHKHTEHVTSDPNSTDTDGDGLSDYEEYKLGTNPESADTDGDGLSDYEEVKELKTSPTRADTDGDGLTDYMEVHGWYVWSESKWVSSDPNSKDTDLDGLSDYEEWKLDTDPRDMDTDSDGIIDKFDKYPTIKEDEKPKMDVPHIYASDGKWLVKNLYVEDNVAVAKVTVLYYDGGSLEDQWNGNVYEKHAWINASVKDDIFDFVKGNKIIIKVVDVNGNQVTYTYSHDLYTDLASIWDKISKFVSGAISTAVKNLISKYPDLAPLIALGWALGESLWSNSIGGLIDIVKDPSKFIEGIKSFISALRSNGVMNTITAVLDGIKKDIESKVNALVSYISDSTKRDEVRQECFDMFVVGEIIGFVVAMAIQPSDFAGNLGSFIEKIGDDAGKLARAFGKIAGTIEKMKSLLRDVKSLALGKLMEKSSALKSAVKELVQSGKMSEKTKELMNRMARWFGKDGVSREENMIKDIAEKLEDGTDSEDIELALEDVKEEYTGGDTGKEKEIFDEHVSFYKYLDGLEHDEDLIKAFGSRAALKKYIEDAKKGYRLVGDETKKSDFENTLKSAVSAVKNGLVEKNTKKHILDIIKSEGYKPEKVYLYAILPRKALVGNQEAIDMLRNVWTKILEKYPLKNGFGRVVKIDKNKLDDLIKAFESGDKSKVEEIIRELKNAKGQYEFGRGKGIFRVKDIHGTTPAEVYEELRGVDYTNDRVIIEFRTEKNPNIFDNLEWKKIDEEPIHPSYKYPYTGTGFIASKDGEILPEYYLASLLTDNEGKSLDLLGIKLIDAKGNVYSIGW